MSLFVCDICGVVENTALSRYWLRNTKFGDRYHRALCSQCDPDIKKWHGKFPRRQYDPDRDEVINRD